MSTARENIMGRMRRVLAGVNAQAVVREEPSGETKPQSQEPLHDRFIAALEKVGGRGILCLKEELPAVLAKVFSPSDRVYVEPAPFLADVDIQGFALENDPDRCDGGITTCEALIAETGTVIIAGGENHKRVSSLVTRTHCIIARRDQCVSTLDDYITSLVRSDPGWPQRISALTFITGPSRTADIEKVLIQGMHGPRELVVVIVG